MSNVNVKRVVENIRENTSVYTAVIEVIVNSIQAIEENKNNNGLIYINIIRTKQKTINKSDLDIIGFDIKDNGIGFTNDNRESFDTLYTDYKVKKGGKGFGRFICLKHFDKIQIESDYIDDNLHFNRKFEMGLDKNIITKEIITKSNTDKTGTVTKLRNLKNAKNFDKKINTIARNITERMFPYFIDKNYNCPTVILIDDNSSERIILNEFYTNEISSYIKEIELEEKFFTIQSFSDEEIFFVRIFKFFSPGNQKSRISLVAHQREVTQTPLEKFIPEFSDEFIEECYGKNAQILKNYIIVAYTSGEYLNKNVSLERCSFNFRKSNDIIKGISQDQIENESSIIAKKAIGEEIIGRQEKKKQRVLQYVDEIAPWHKSMVKDIDLSDLPFRPTDEEIEIKFQKEKFTKERETRVVVKEILKSNNIENLNEKTQEIVSTLSLNSKNDLIHYIAQRKIIIDIFEKSLEINSNGEYFSEGTVHDTIFPRRNNTDSINCDQHNLWILDERLNFNNFISSDEPLDAVNSDRPDLLIFNKRIAFRGDNEPSNPVTIFEFKKPYRDDFVNPSSKEDPIQQIVRYVNQIREGKYKTPKGRAISISENTPFYGYVICDLSPKVTKWLKFDKNFKPMPDQLGWYQWHDNINLYIEVLSWEKLLKDTQTRNKIFFHKLGI